MNSLYKEISNGMNAKAWSFVFISMILLCISSFCSITQTLLFSKIIDYYQSNKDFSIIIISLVLCFTVSRTFNEILIFFISYIEAQITNHLQKVYINKILHKNISFFKKNPAGEILAKLGYIEGIVNTKTRNIFFSIIPVALNFIFLIITVELYFEVKYLNIILLSFIIYFFLLIFGSTYLDNKAKENLHIRTKVFSAKSDLILNRTLLRIFNAEYYEFNKFKTYLSTALLSAMTNFNRRGIYGVIQALIVSSSIGITFYISYNDLLSKKISIGSFILINSYMIQFLTPLDALCKVFREIKTYYLQLEILNNTINSFPDMEFGNKEIDISNGIEIEFKNVYFKYPDSDRLILDNVSFKIPANSFIAIVGESGSGKSTLAALISRLYEPTEGEIFFNGININELSRESFHKCFANVSQIPQILTDNILNNLSLGEEKNNVKQVCEKLGIDKFINKLPESYETQISLHDKRFSEGQLQRISLARGILSNKPILLLDEITSALDKITE